MVKEKKQTMISTGTIALNRKARFNYAITETFEAGIALLGSEVKSLRQGKASIGEAYVADKDGVLCLLNANIPEYDQSLTKHDPKRARPLLLKTKQIKDLMGKIKTEGLTIIPLALYFNKRGIAKVEIGLAKGKKTIDKREDIKKRDWSRQKQRLMKN